MLVDLTTDLGTRQLYSLVAIAPEKPDESTLREWDRQFYADYPDPWRPEHTEASVRAREAASRAVAKAMGLRRQEREIVGVRRLTSSPWWVWRKECLTKFLRDDWPLLWATRQLESADRVREMLLRQPSAKP